jgi:hypothetical protein
MFNAHGTFYEVPREGGFAQMRPIATHKKQILDFCTWRGLLVLSGTEVGAPADGHVFKDAATSNSLWFGAIDDLWKLGKPVGEGGMWKDAPVKAGEPSLPFLMTGYDNKMLTLSAETETTISVEVDFAHNGWVTYREIAVKPGAPVQHIFPAGYNAHWVRVRADTNTTATAWMRYE